MLVRYIETSMEGKTRSTFLIPWFYYTEEEYSDGPLPPKRDVHSIAVITSSRAMIYRITTSCRERPCVFRDVRAMICTV